LSDFGQVVLRVRDTGHGLVAAAMEPFRTPRLSPHPAAHFIRVDPPPPGEGEEKLAKA
jgi:hypothetical protein